MSEPDEQDIIQWQDALRWLDRAMDDIRATRVLLRDGIAMQAAFHLQQAIEKTLKALLVAARQDVRKTHDLDTLAELARAQRNQTYPDWQPSRAGRRSASAAIGPRRRGSAGHAVPRRPGLGPRPHLGGPELRLEVPLPYQRHCPLHRATGVRPDRGGWPTR